MAEWYTWQNDPPEQLLLQRFCITTGFHSGQRDIIEQLVQGQRILAIQRTGWGKSLCYQMASLYYPHLTLVFSPLKALMRDQCQRCNESYALPAAIVSSDFSEEENKASFTRAITGDLKILFIAPERLMNNEWQKHVIRMRISMIVVDEAHCISTWGHDFRPDYRRIVTLLNAFPKNTPVLALTATANQRVEQDILAQVGTEATVIRGMMQRPNLHLNVVRVSGDWEKLCYLGEVLLQRSDTGIIYCASQSSAEMVALFLSLRGVKAEYYHAGRDDNVRQEVEKKWMANHYTVLCTTTALGMGIDKRDIRFVIHYHMSASLLHYYQEIGRAGRDGDRAWCILLYDPEDLAIQEHLTANDRPKEGAYKRLLSVLHAAPQGMNEYNLMLTTGLPRNAVKIALADLEDQAYVEVNTKLRTYTAIPTTPTSQLDFSEYEAIRTQKLQELYEIRAYAQGQRCYMEYVCHYIGDQTSPECGICGACRTEYFPPIRPSERIQALVARFLDEEYLPHIDARGNEYEIMHEAGWSLAYHGTSRIGKLVSMSKYAQGGPFALSLVMRTAEIIRARYPIHILNGVVSIPPTKGSMLVEMFARQVANMLGIEYLPLLVKTRETQKQKHLTNRVQKAANVKDAFSLLHPDLVVGRTLLLMDDIYDSGYTLREAGRVLLQSGAQAVYPFTITRTFHSDDQ